jgi:hypothetical protein
VWPRVLGAALDAVVTALDRADGVTITRLPRMADFAVWVVAAEPALGLEEGAFLDAYRRNRREANAVALEASLVAVEVRRFMDIRKEWDGTATELLRELNETVDEDIRRTKEWPKTGRGLSGKIRRLAPALRRAGIQAEFAREGHDRTRTITLTPTQPDTHKVRNQPSEPSAPSSQVSNEDDADDADGTSPTPSPPRRMREYPEGDRSPTDSNGHGDEETALELLKTELGAIDTEILDFIDARRREGDDFTRITAAVKRMDFPPPPGRAAWDLATVVQAYGILHQ